MKLRYTKHFQRFIVYIQCFQLFNIEQLFNIIALENIFHGNISVIIKNCRLQKHAGLL